MTGTLKITIGSSSPVALDLSDNGAESQRWIQWQDDGDTSGGQTFKMGFEHANERGHGTNAFIMQAPNGNDAQIITSDGEMYHKEGVRMPVAASDAAYPATAKKASMYYNSTNDVMKVYNGSEWVSIYEPPARGTEQNPATSMADLKAELGTVSDGDYWFVSTNSNIGTTTFRVESEWIVIPLTGDATVSGAAAASQSSFWNNASRRTEYAFGTASTAESTWESNNRWYYYDNSGPNTGAAYVIYDLGLPFRYVKIASTWQSATAYGSGGQNADWGAETGAGNIGTSFISFSDHPFELYPNGSGTSMTSVSGNTSSFSSLIASGGWTVGEVGNATISWTSNTIDTGAGNNRTEIGFGAGGGDNEDYRLNSSKWYIK